MKVLVQHTLATPGGWTEIDSKDWAKQPKKPEPVGGEVIDDQPGWIYSVNVQGITFSGDHYAVIHRQDGGCEVIVWNDDAGDYAVDEFSAQRRVFLSLGPDPAQGGAINTRQSCTLYAGSKHPWYDNPPQNVTVRSWSEFTPPHDRLTRHGIWVSDVLSDQHVAVRPVRGWREWTDGVDSARLDPETGHVAVQRALGFWRKAEGTITYYQRDTDRAVAGITSEHEDAFETTTNTSATETATVPASTSFYNAWVFLTGANEPNSADWPDGSYRIQYDVTAIAVTVAITSTTFRRVNTDGSNIENLGTDATDVTATGTHIRSVSHNPDAGDATDRYRVDVICSNSDEHMAADITLQLNTTDSFADGPWGAVGAANPKGPLGHPLHGPFGGPI